MNITIGTTNDPPAVIGKTVEWAEPLGTPVTRETISTRDPVIIITGYEITPATNYARIVWGETDTRYYFITAVEKLTGNRTRIKMRVDVLETYRDKIGALSVVAERASSFANRYIADGIQQTSAKPQIIFKQFSGNTPFISDSVTSATRCIVVRAIAREVTT